MALVVTQRGTNNSGGVATSVTVTLTASPASGSTIVVSTAIYNIGATTPGVTDNQSNTYTQVAAPSTQGNLNAVWWYLQNCPASITTITLSVGVGDYLVVHVYEVSGAAITGQPDSHGISGTTSSSPSATVGDTTVNAATVVFGSFSGLSSAVATPGSGWTLGYANDSVAVVAVTLDDVYQIVAAQGTYAPNITYSINQASGYSAMAVAIYAAAAGGVGVESHIPDPVAYPDKVQYLFV